MKESKNQQNFLNFFQNEFGITRTAKFLDKLNKIVPWSSIANDIENKRKLGSGGVGRPKIETIKMIKILFLQGLYGLSDPEAEDQIRDRNSFQIFLGIKSAKEVPDETTICRFRGELNKTEGQESIFSMTQFIVAEMGFNMKKGYMQDGTIVEAPKGRKNKNGENTRDTDLEDLEISPQFNEKGVRNNPLTAYQKEKNRIKSGVRAKVEHPFATLKTRYGNYKIKYRGMLKNAMHWFLSCAIYNFELLARRYS